MSKPVPGPDFSIAPTGWGARVNYDTWTDTLKEPQEGIAIHHGGGGDYAAHKPPYTQAKEMSQLRAWEAYHIDGRGWRGIAYNWAVGMTGTVYRLRGWNLNGAHLGDLDQDGLSNQREILAVLFIMSGDVVQPSPEMLAGFEKLRGYIESHQGALRLYGHKEVQLDQPTACPGKYNMAYVTTHRDSPVVVEPPALEHFRRIAGANRYATAALLAFEDPTTIDLAVVADGTPDAQAAAALGVPLLFVSRDALPAETAQAVVQLNPQHPVIVGGANAVSDKVAAELDALL